MKRKGKLVDSLLGRSFINKYGDVVSVVEVQNAKCVIVRFVNGYEKAFQKNALLLGNFKSPYSKTLCGVGYLGEGTYKTYGEKRKHSPHYVLWHNMISRVYNKDKKFNQACYKDVTVCTAWHNFQSFAEWCDSQEGFNLLDENGKLFALDKDLIGGGVKIYSPETCCFIPPEINSFLTNRISCRGNLPVGVSLQSGRYKATCNWLSKAFYFENPVEAFNKFKVEKEIRAKDLAGKWKPFISDKAYESLIDYCVDIKG